MQSHAEPRTPVRLAPERRAHLLGVLATDGRIVASHEAKRLGVSEDSIRRDLRDLADDGLVMRVHGGALPASPAIGNYEARTDISTGAKRAIGAFAAGLITPGSTVFVDGGTTALELVHALAISAPATVLTHSPTIATALAPHHAVDVWLIGGRLFRHSMVTCGAAALEDLAGVSVDVAFIGVTGVHPRRQLTTGDADEAAMKRAIVRAAGDCWVLASNEKIGAASHHRVCGFADVTGVITDRDAPRSTVTALRRQGVRMEIAT